MNITQQVNLTAGILALLPGLKTTAQNQQSAQHPNIIYIMSDDHAYQAISAYGSDISKLAPTPNIDRIAKAGVTFDQAFVENSLSTPSRACTITGLYSHQNGQEQLNEGIDTTKVFVSELLQQCGYQTGLIGKWHIPCTPKGFDYYHIYNGQGEYYNPQFKGTDTGGRYVQEQGYSADLVASHAKDFLDHRDKSKPFFLMVHFKAPHRNQMPNLKYLGLFDDVTFPLPATFYDDYATRCSAARTQRMSITKDLELIQDLKVVQMKDSLKDPYNQEFSWMCYRVGVERMTPEQRAAWNRYYIPRGEQFINRHLTGNALSEWKYQAYMRDYLACVRSVDDNVGQILDYLKVNGLDSNTVIIYTSDQGFYLGEHNWFDKRFMYEQSLRTPLLMAWKGHINPGQHCSAMVQNIDYAPTFLQLSGGKKTGEMSGRSLTEVWNGKMPADWRKSIYYHYYDYPAFHQVRRHDGVRTERYKLIHFYGKGGHRAETRWYQTDPKTTEHRILQMLRKLDYTRDSDPDIDSWELYDLKADPNEVNNIFGQPGTEKITKDLKSMLNKYRKDLKVKEY